VTRTLDPHGIVLKAGKWYLVARDAAAKAVGDGPADAPMRTYRINQILGMTVPGERFDRVPDFDLAVFWASSVAGFRAGLWQGEAKIRLSAAGRDRLGQTMSPAVASAADSTVSPPDQRGWVTAVVPIESVGHAHQDFLRLGAEVEVLEPEALRALLAGTARSLATLYATG
jgi:predicted DNA-binding transcriptional regulator YafY